jgi:hypothetical protein
VSDRSGTPEHLALQGAAALRPLASWLADDTLRFLADLGVELPDTPGTAEVRAAAAVIGESVEGLVAPVEALVAVLGREPPSQPEILAASADLLVAVDGIARRFPTLRDAVAGLAELPPAARQTLGQTLVRRLVDYVVIAHLEREWPLLMRVLVFLGVIELEFVERDAATLRPSHVRRSLNLENLKALVDPSPRVLERVYAWGQPDFRAEALLRILSEIGLRAYLPAYYAKPEDGPARIDLGPLELVHRADLAPPGLALQLDATIPERQTVEVPVRPLGWKIEILAGVVTTRPLAAVLQPGRGLRLQTPGAVEEGTLGLRVTYAAAEPTGKVLVLGQLGGTRLEADRAVAESELVLHPQADAALDYRIEAGVEGGVLVLSLAGADGLVASLLAGEIRLDLDAGLGYSPARGLHLRQGTGLAATLPISIQLGPAFIDSVTLELAAADEGLRLDVGMAVVALVGPVALIVDRVGVRLDVPIGAREDRPVDLRLGFRPPSGVGIEVMAPGVGGGGYLTFDPERGQYAGALDLVFAGLGLKAVGLLSTRLPDGQPGYAFIGLVTARFVPGIQLGYGFTLQAVGGLIGLHRAASVDALRAGLGAGTLGSLLFPADPLRDAARILRDLEACFPTAPGRHVFGPMLEIGWGVPHPVLRVQLGVVLELPEPLRLLLLGRIRMALPHEALPLARINLDVLGVVDFARETVALDGTLVDSVVGIYALTGDMALRLAYGARPEFALAIGGLHPRYAPPSGFPALRRVALAMTTGNNPRVRLEAYLALTANTVQIGARVELYAETAGFSIEGLLGFDALFHARPFRFTADLRARLALKRGDTVLMSVDVAVTLSGVAPWRVQGDATFQVLFVKASIHFDRTFGSAREELPLTVDVWPLLLAALRDPRSWRAELPAEDGDGRLVALRADEGSSAAPRAHPAALLTVRQQVAPLGLTLERFGGATPIGSRRFTIAGTARVGAGSAARSVPAEPVPEHFAPSQFLELTEAEQLASPSFERLTAGVAVGGGLRMGAAVARPLAYEELAIDRAGGSCYALATLGSTIGVSAGEADRQARGAAGRRGPRVDAAAFFRVRRPGVAVRPPAFVAADADSLAGLDLGEPGPGRPRAYAEIRDGLARAVATGRLRRQRVQVVEAHELVTV